MARQKDGVMQFADATYVALEKIEKQKQLLDLVDWGLGGNKNLFYTDKSGCRKQGLRWEKDTFSTEKKAAFIKNDPLKIASRDLLYIGIEGIREKLFRPTEIEEIEFFYGVKFNNKVMVDADVLLSKLKVVRDVFEPYGFVINCYQPFKKKTEKPGYLIAEETLKVKESTEFALYIYKKYHFKNSFELDKDEYIDADKAFDTYKKEVLDLAIPNLKKIFEQFLVVGVEAIKNR